MKGEITVRIEGLMRHYPVERIYVTPQIEHFRVSGRNGVIVFQSNRPYLRGNGLRMKRIDWKLIEGNLRSMSAKDAFAQSLDDYVKQLEKEGKL
ncbi:hypothetical protein D3H65_05105 [Paraflavitalea soli]|uniref:Uncharacterized protein n=1 Tax=Paraflavitalea soli TaxID=2315862 RepID=A0A3B7MGA7_9BACT|nr:hypothetical protein [Paraflavitalea soli]AXY73394.1 hypothetical protein D3H65_05105 [Paraflavitalea soli]